MSKFRSKESRTYTYVLRAWQNNTGYRFITSLVEQ